MMKNTNKILLCLITIFCFIEPGIKAQNQDASEETLPFLEELRQALFPPDEPKISGKYHPNCIEDEGSSYYREWEELDTIIMVRVNQPDKDRVCNLLHKIAMTKNYAYYEPLLEIYELQQTYFEREWIFFRKWYSMLCKANNDPIIIMNGFEHALFTLELAHLNVSKSELIYAFDNYISSLYEKHNLKTNKEKEEGALNNAKKTIMYYHYNYLKDNPLNPGFGFYSFFMEELEDHLIEKVMVLDVNDFYQLRTENFEAWFKSNEFQFILLAMSNIQSRKFEQVLQLRFDDIASSRKVIHLFTYAQSNKEVSPQFIRFLLDKIYTHERFKDDLKAQKSFSSILSYLLNTHTRPVIKEYLMQRTEAINQEDRLRTWSYLVYFTNEPEVLQLMLDKSQQKNLSPEESKVLGNNFQRMLKAEDFPAESKKLVEEQYKKIRHETKE
jgi:hypothetical protein